VRMAASNVPVSARAEVGAARQIKAVSDNNATTRLIGPLLFTTQ
jgi:hypothetical protein